MRQLHFLRLLANHHQQHAAEQMPVKTNILRYGKRRWATKRQHGDDAGKEDSKQDAVSDRPSPSFNR